MRHIIEPSNNRSWISINPHLEQSELMKRIKSSDILISDLDDTDAPSPAKSIAFSKLKETDYILNPKFWVWCLSTGYALLTKQKNAESETWKNFVETFLRDQKELDKIKNKYNPKYVNYSFYPCVKEFYNLLPEDMIKIYITRNVIEVGEAYKQGAGFDEVMAEQFDKEDSIKKVCEKYPNKKSFIIKGDSPEDEAIIDFLRFRKRKDEIELITSIYVAKSSDEKEINPRFDINIGQNYEGLVQILEKDIFRH